MRESSNYNQNTQPVALLFIQDGSSGWHFVPNTVFWKGSLSKGATANVFEKDVNPWNLCDLFASIFKYAKQSFVEDKISWELPFISTSIFNYTNTVFQGGELLTNI